MKKKLQRKTKEKTLKTVEYSKTEDDLAQILNVHSQPFMLEMVLKVTGTGLVITDEKHTIRFMNESWEKKCGDFKEKKCFNYFMGLTSPCGKCGVCKVLETGVTHITEKFLPAMGRNYQIISHPFRLNTGEKLVAEIYIDITERKIVEDKIYKLSPTVEQSPCVIVITDISGRIEYVNPRFTELTGYTLEEVIGENVNILKSGEIPSIEYKLLWETIMAGKKWRGEFHNKKKNGELYWEFASISPIKNSEGLITHFLAIKEDITERKRMEEELRRAREKAEVSTRVKSRFLANISHELRTPMNSILGISKSLMTKSCSNLTEKQIKGLNLINQSGNRLLNLINDILDLSRLEAGKTELAMEKIFLNMLISEVEEFVNSILVKDRVKFFVKKEEGLPLSMYSDRKKIIQILINLLANAVKFTHKGEIELRLYRENNHLVFAVRDTGIGIAPEHLNMLFEEFKQIDSGYTKSYEGTGLGLAISKKLALLLNGEIRVESQAGVGSTFSFLVPYFEV